MLYTNPAFVPACAVYFNSTFFQHAKPKRDFANVKGQVAHTDPGPPRYIHKLPLGIMKIPDKGQRGNGTRSLARIAIDPILNQPG